MTSPYVPFIAPRVADWKRRFQENSAVGGLLNYATTEAGITPPQPQPAMPPMLQAQASAPPQAQAPAVPPMLQEQAGEDVHEHRKGLRGFLPHLLGIDRRPAEIDALLQTDDERRRVMPGVASTLWNAVSRQVGPQQVQQERAENIVGLRDTKTARDRSARNEALMAQIQGVAANMPPQEAAEYVSRMATILQLPGFGDTAQAAERMRQRDPMQVPRGAAVRRADGSWEIPAPITPEPEVATPETAYEEREEHGGVAIYENGRFKTWKVRPPTPASPFDRRMEATYASQNRAMDDTLDAIRTYREQLAETGVQVMPGAAQSRLTGAYANLKLRAKEAAELGALTGPDVVILEELFNSPTGASAAARNLLTGGRQKQALLEQLAQYENIIRSSRARLRQNYNVQGSQRIQESYNLPNQRDDQ